jgi:hypothetical protein
MKSLDGGLTNWQKEAENVVSENGDEICGSRLPLITR